MRSVCFGSGSMTPQQRRQILRERGARQYHIATRFLRLHLQLALHMRNETDDCRSLFQFFFQLGDDRQRLGVDVIQVDDDERRFFIAIVFYAIQNVFVGLHELDFYIQLARHFLDLRQEKQVVDESKNLWRRILILVNHGFDIRMYVRSCDCRAASAGSATRKILLAIAVAVIHGTGEDLVLLVIAAVVVTGSGMSRPAGRPPASTAPPPFPSRGTGGIVRSNIHIFLFAVVTAVAVKFLYLSGPRTRTFALVAAWADCVLELCSLLMFCSRPPSAWMFALESPERE